MLTERAPLWMLRIWWAYQDGVMWPRFKNAAAMKIAWWLPRGVAYWCFFRVYGSWGECGPDFAPVLDAWEQQGKPPRKR